MKQSGSERKLFFLCVAKVEAALKTGAVSLPAVAALLAGAAAVRQQDREGS
jgi:hypothetical protein